MGRARAAVGKPGSFFSHLPFTLSAFSAPWVESRVSGGLFVLGREEREERRPPNQPPSFLLELRPRARRAGYYMYFGCSLIFKHVVDAL